MRRALLAGVALLLALPATASAHGWTETDLWRFADRLQERIDGWWSPTRNLYRPGDLSSDTQVNAQMLYVHSIAALRGHDGPARQDDRARAIAARMVQSPPFVDVLGRQFGQRHAPGWAGAMTAGVGMQHLVVDAEVAEALAAALRARAELALPPELVAAIQDRLYRVAASPFWRYPTIRLNQINWYASVYSAAADATGDLSFLRRDLHHQIARFVRGIRHPPRDRAGNLAGGMRFQYSPGSSPNAALNFDSPEYANMVASFTRYWTHARRLGMRTLPAEDRRLIKRWLRRVLTGYWTHAGYLNWDTGFGFRRLHQAKKIGLAQLGLLGIASAGRELTPGPRWSRWAKDLLDRGFELYESWLPEGEGLPPALLFDVHAHPTTASHTVLAAARIEANAARAVHLGLGGRGSPAPLPPLYAFDPDDGRLAVTTPRYSTAIVPVNHGAFPYGGLDIARLFDGDQNVAANIGGVPPAAFGLTVRDRRGHLELATQRPRLRAPEGRRPLRLLRAPSGVGVKPDAPPTRAYAGRFRVLVAAGHVARRGLVAHTRYRFTRNSIVAGWRLRAETRGRRTVEVGFPSRAADEPQVTAVLASGERIAVTGESRLRVSAVRHFTIDSGAGGYRVVPRHVPRHAVARLVQPRAQSSAPRPGPTLTIALPNRKRVEFGARIVPAVS